MNDQGFSVELEAWDPAIRADFDSGPFAQENLNVGGWGVGVFLGDPAFAYQRWTAGDFFALSYMDNAEMNQLYQDILVEADAANRTTKGAPDAGDRRRSGPLDSVHGIARSVRPGGRIKSPT